jgi:hypothetical protein
LMGAALKRGAPDNVSVIVVDLVAVTDATAPQRVATDSISIGAAARRV